MSRAENGLDRNAKPLMGLPSMGTGERGYTLDDVLGWTTAPPEELSLMVRDGLFLLMQWMGEDDDE